jgi:hypothetical protein
MIGTGKSLRVTVNPGAVGTWKKPEEHVCRDVYAIGYEGGDERREKGAVAGSTLGGWRS